MDSSLYDKLYSKKDRTVLLNSLKPFMDRGLKCYEIGAGTGLVASRLGNRFGCYVAIEPENNYFEALEAKCDGSFKPINGYIEVDNQKDYDLGLCVFNVINHIKTHELKMFISQNAQKLKDGGVFYFDCYRYDAVIQTPPMSHNFLLGEDQVFVETQLNNNIIELNYYLNQKLIEKMSLNIHKETDLQSCIKDYFTNFTVNHLRGRHGDYYFSEYICEI